jgi:serine/threonine protein kinase
MTTPGNIEELKVKVGLKYTDPKKEYEFLDKLGEGSYGSVLHAKHLQTHTLHAIKQVPVEDNLSDLLKETEHMMECKCENIVGYDACFLVNNQLWIVMELCTGGSLNDLMKLSKMTLNEEQIAVCVRDILSALAYLHDNGRIHRDIKAGNVLLTSEGVAKLADFGVSGTLSKDTAQRHTVIGTPFWMAPEVIQETGHNYKADIWSLGITLIELAEGHPPLCNLHPLRAIFVIPTRAAPTFTDKTKWSPEMNEFLSLCLTKDATQRPTAKQLQKHPWLLKYANVSGAVLKPLLELSDAAIVAAGGRDAAINALYDDSEGSDTESGSGSGSDDDDDDGSGSGSDGGDTEVYGTMQIKTDDADYSDGDEDEYSTMKVKKSPAKQAAGSASGSAGGKASKKSSKKKSKKNKDEDEDYGTMKVVKDDPSGAGSGSDSGEVEDLGTIQIKKSPKPKKKKSKSQDVQKDDVSTVVVKKDVGAKLKEERLSTLAKGDSPRVRAMRQDIDELDVAMVAKLQTISKELTKDREMIASILAARKA